MVLGHLLAGGSPTALDRLLGLSLWRRGCQSVRRGTRWRDGGADPPDINYVPLAQAIERLKTVPTAGYGVTMAGPSNISLGD